MTVAVGIDLGTTNTVVGAVRSGKPTTLVDEFGRTLLPSIVSFHPMGQVLVGDPAKERRLNDPKNTIYGVKRLLGRRWSSPEVQRLRTQIPFDLVEGIRESVSVMARGETYALPEISAFVLRRARDFAMQAVGDDITSAVITVPANFNDLQRASTKVAGQLADLEVLRIMNEPTAAALAYGQHLQGAQRIAVYDFGGGTFDLSLLDLSADVYEVLMTKGDTSLGGDDIDMAIALRMAHHVMRTLNINTDAPELKGRLRLYAEHVKIALSDATETEIVLAGLGHGPGGKELETSFRMTRADLEHLAAPFIERTMLICRQAMAAANLPVHSFDAVVLVGGSTRMPAVAARVAEIFKKQPHADVNPEEVVALGAAIQAQNLSRAVRKTGPKAPLPPAVPAPEPGVPTHFAALPHAPPTFPVSDAPPPPLPQKTQTMPAAVMPKPPSLPTAVMPVVMKPATLPTAVKPPALPSAPPLSDPKPMPGPLLVDVTPLSLGVETAGGYTDAILAAGMPVPCDKTRIFVTASDRQTNVVVRVAQGESRMFAENTYLGECFLQNLRSAPRGEVKIAVTFEIDANGILVVRAKDAETGQETKAHIRAFGAQLEPQEIAAMQQRMAGLRISPPVVPQKGGHRIG